MNIYPTVDSYDSDVEIRIGKSDSLLTYPSNGIVEINSTYYRIDSLRPDERYVLLSEEYPDKQQEALKKGFRPFSFTTETIDGKTIHFPNDFQGKYVLLDFWATSCAPCVKEIKEYYIPAYEMYRKYGFEIISIADNTREEIEHFTRKTPMPWTQVADKEQENAVQKIYDIIMLPTLFLLDKAGNIIAINHEIRGELIMKKLQELMPEAR